MLDNEVEGFWTGQAVFFWVVKNKGYLTRNNVSLNFKKGEIKGKGQDKFEYQGAYSFDTDPVQIEFTISLPEKSPLASHFPMVSECHVARYFSLTADSLVFDVLAKQGNPVQFNLLKRTDPYSLMHLDEFYENT